jgi:poly-gamma-glutamate capsule biosynthesis protein CapA/YwtB (metallophosphatase superfamily)
VPCDVEVSAPVLAATASCVRADRIGDALVAEQQLVALLPPGLVEPATKVLPIAGDGPFGLFGPDLFGDAEARGLPYPVTGSAAATGPASLDPAWTAYDASEIWTMTDIGSLCADRWAARQAVTLGKGWHWVFNGGTAKYNGKPIPNPNPPPGIDRHPIVRPVATGNDGVVAAIQSRADVAIADHECPIMPAEDWAPNPGRGLAFSVPEDVLKEWRDTLGLDAVYLAANHMSDRGVRGIRSTLNLLDEDELPRTGLGMDLDQALEPAYVDVAGLRIGFVAHNDVGGVARADADTAGVAWITKANVDEAVRRAEAGGADLVICNPQWWGGVEYHDDLLPKQVTQLGWFDDAGCDHVIGAGTHVAGPMLLRKTPDDVSLVLASPGNYVFGQDFWQNTQEGVILEQKFRGTKLVNVRLHPYVIILAARPSLLDPEGDGHYVLERIWRNSDVDYRPD